MRYMKDYTLLVKQCSIAFFYKSICFIACKTKLDSNVKYTKYLKSPVPSMTLNYFDPSMPLNYFDLGMSLNSQSQA